MLKYFLDGAQMHFIIQWNEKKKLKNAKIEMHN